MTSLSAAVAQQRYELAALRLLLGLLAAIERFESNAPEAREQLLVLLAMEQA